MALREGLCMHLEVYRHPLRNVVNQLPQYRYRRSWVYSPSGKRRRTYWVSTKLLVLANGRLILAWLYPALSKTTSTSIVGSCDHQWFQKFPEDDGCSCPLAQHET
jgi:hypothetical protein